MTTAGTALGQAEAVLPEPRRRRRRTKNVADDDSRKINWWVTALIAVCSLTILIPLYLAVVVALKTPDQLAAGTGFEWPNPVRWENFAEAWEPVSYTHLTLPTILLV